MNPVTTPHPVPAARTHRRIASVHRPAAAGAPDAGASGPGTPDVGRVVSRPMRPDDAARLERLFHRLSAETLYRRFFSPVVRPDPKMLEYLCAVDHHDREAIVALVDDEIIGVARFDRLTGEPDTAEVAVVVEDTWQGLGVGRHLMQALGRAATRTGITSFCADVLASNDAPVKLARAVAPLVEVSFVDGETHLVIPLPGPRRAVGAPRQPRRSA